MKFSVQFINLAAARAARRDLTRQGMLRWSDLTSLHDGTIRVDQLPLEHTSARRGAVFGATVLGLTCALVLAGVSATFQLGFGVAAALAIGAGVGLLHGGIFGAIAFSTRPAPFVLKDAAVLETTGGAMLVCDIGDPNRAEVVRAELERYPTVQAA